MTVYEAWEQVNKNPVRVANVFFDILCVTSWKKKTAVGYFPGYLFFERYFISLRKPLSEIFFKNWFPQMVWLLASNSTKNTGNNDSHLSHMRIYYTDLSQWRNLPVGYLSLRSFTNTSNHSKPWNKEFEEFVDTGHFPIHTIFWAIFHW